MRKTNRFLAGPQVSGDSFFGRRSELDRLGEWMFGAIPCCGLSIVGPHRIGKSSLVAQVLREHAGQENVLVIRMNMAEYPDAASFWYIFAEELEERDCVRRAYGTMTWSGRGRSWSVWQPRPTTGIFACASP